jgi:hypothetical protein
VSRFQSSHQFEEKGFALQMTFAASASIQEIVVAAYGSQTHLSAQWFERLAANTGWEFHAPALTEVAHPHDKTIKISNTIFLKK